MLVTADNIREVIARVPADQALDMAPGCETWSMPLYGGTVTGYITVWPNMNVAAVSWGQGSFWGRWHPRERVILLDDSIGGCSLVVDAQGRMWVYMEPGEFYTWMEERFVRCWDIAALEKAAAGDAPENLYVSVGCSRLPVFRGEELAGELLAAMLNPEQPPYPPSGTMQ